MLKCSGKFSESLLVKLKIQISIISVIFQVYKFSTSSFTYHFSSVILVTGPAIARTISMRKI